MSYMLPLKNIFSSDDAWLKQRFADKNNSIIIYKHLAELYEKINENAKAIECSEKVEELEEYRNILLVE